VGEGRPVLLIHGLFSNAFVNWIKFGHAERIAVRGYRVIMPDLRAHGESASPHDPACYPPDVLSHDALALIANLQLQDYDLGGYSLGGRTAIRAVLMGATPRRLIVSGMGLEGLLHARERSDHFHRVLTGLGTFERGSPEWLAEAFLKTTKGDSEALLPLLESFVDTAQDDLANIVQPTLVLSGSEDRDNGSSEKLAELLPDARFVEVPGNHMNVVTKPAFGREISEFLA
jgi:pimeloyl-ACP methyl ester carboxylesterase